MSASNLRGPGRPASSRYWASCRSLSTFSTADVSHCSFSASRPCVAGQYPSATTATPSAPRSSGTRSTAFTPLTARAALSSTEAKARAEHRRTRHHGRQLTGQANVDAEVLPPAALGARVQARRGAADDAEILRILQRDLLGHGQRHGGLGQFAVTQLAAIRAQHRAGLRAQGGHVHVPARRGSTQQHGPGARAELAILRKAVLDRIGTAGEVNAEAAGRRRRHRSSRAGCAPGSSRRRVPRPGSSATRSARPDRTPAG